MRRNVTRRFGGVDAVDASAALAVNAWTAFDNTERVVLFIGSVLCSGACLWIASLLGIPRDPHFNGSLLAGGAPIAGIVAAGVSIATCVIIGAAVATFIEMEAGLFCSCIGLAALGVRCGPIRPVLQYAQGSKVFLALSVESGLLGILLVGGWFGMLRFIKIVRQSDYPVVGVAAPNEITDATLQQKLTTLGVQVLAMGICEQILIQSDAKAQSMAGVMFSAFAGSMAAYAFTPLAEGIWYWTGPAVLGVIGFLLANFNASGLVIGDLHGWSAPLALATPLDYAAMGTAGALLGYWCMRRWQQPEETNGLVPAPASGDV